MSESDLIIGQELCTIEDVLSVAYSKRPVRITDNKEWQEKFVSSVKYLDRACENEIPVYGVNTGYGRSCDVNVSKDLIFDLPLQLSRFHGCGLGKFFSKEESRAIMLVRAVSFCRGLSGISIELLNLICELINKDVVPVIPSEGSVGASGDLTPLSYLAAVLIGEREVYYKNEVRTASEVFEELDLSPKELRPKEALALMNGTSVMTALACIAYQRAEQLLKFSVVATAMNSLSLGTSREHFNPKFFEAKPFPGQLKVAAELFGLVQYADRPDFFSKGPIQARYSIRCAPHILGVLGDALVWIKQHIEIELNSANDNPLICGEEEMIFHGGHFYGGHIAFAMDSLKNAVANVADLLDRQLMLLVDSATNNGLPRNLSGARGERAAINHGFKAVQIATSAWSAEALKQTMPASVFSRSTESHNQDKVSMGTIAARDALRVLELTEQVLVATLVSGVQAIELRIATGELSLEKLDSNIRDMFEKIRECVPFLEEDCRLDQSMSDLLNQIQGFIF